MTAAGALGDHIYRNARVPRSLVGDEARFGGMIDGDCLVGDLVLRRGSVAGMAIGNLPDQPSTDLEGRLVMPRFTEAHCHLDKCHTFPRLQLAGLTLANAIAAHEADRLNCTEDDIRARAERGLTDLYAAGCSAVRTHIDWTVDSADPDRAPLAWHVLGELEQEWHGRIELQRTALFSIDDFADRALADILARRIAREAGVLGAFVLDHADRAAKIANMIQAAKRHEVMLDFHVDEDARCDHGGLELIADALVAAGFDRPVLCGHGCGLAVLSGDLLARRIEKIASAGIALAVLPTTNLYLQHRDASGGTPDGRGITRVNELGRAGVPIVFGSDNARDGFCPTGFHDPLRALSLGVLAAHLQPPMGRWLPTVSSAASAAVGLGKQSMERLPVDQLITAEAVDTSKLLSIAAPRRRSLYNAALERG